MPRASWYTPSAVTASAAASTAAASQASTLTSFARRGSLSVSPSICGEHGVGVVVPLAVQHEPVDLRAVGDRLLAVLVGRWGDAAQVVDELVDAGVVQAPLDVIAEQRAERNALAHAVEEPLGQAHPVGRQLDREGALGAAAVGEVGLAHQRRGGRLVERRRDDEPRIVRRRGERSRLAGRQLRHRRPRLVAEVLDPAVGAEHDPSGCVVAELGEAAGGQRRDPRVEPVGGGVEHRGQQPLDRRGIGGGELRHRLAQLAEGADRRRLEVGESGEVFAHGARRRGARHRLAALPVPRRGRRRSGHEVDELGVGEQLVERLGRAGEQAGGGLGLLAEQGVAEQRVEQRHRVVGHRRGEGVGVAGEQRIDVVHRAVGAVAHERNAERRPGVLVDEQVERHRAG